MEVTAGFTSNPAVSDRDTAWQHRAVRVLNLLGFFHAPPFSPSDVPLLQVDEMCGRGCASNHQKVFHCPVLCVAQVRPARRRKVRELVMAAKRLLRDETGQVVIGRCSRRLDVQDPGARHRGAVSERLTQPRGL